MVITEVHSNITVHFNIENENDLIIPNVVYGFVIKGDSCEYKYVGKSYHGLRHRIISHCSDCWKRTDNSKKSNVMRKYKELVAFIIKRCDDMNEMDAEERYQIKENHKNYGRSCLNTLLLIKDNGDMVTVADIDSKYQVEQYDLNGQYIKTFPSIRCAAKETGTCRNLISRVLHGTNKTAGGFQWKKACSDKVITAVNQSCIKATKLRPKRVETREERKAREQKARGKIILQYSLSGDFIAEYPSLHEAERLTKVNIKAISNCCNGIFKQSGGYQFRYKGSPMAVNTNVMTRSESTRVFNISEKGIKVAQYDKNMNFIKSYDSINQVKNELGFSGIGLFVNKDKMSHGFYWKTI